MGRPRTFDETEVVSRATELFWTNGYEATSVAELSAELGVHPGSLYRTFGDKRALFLRALDHYRDAWARRLGPLLCSGGPVLPKVRAVFVTYIKQASGSGPARGCLVANSAGELMPGDAQVGARLAETLAIVEQGFREGLSLAVEQGELDADPDQVDEHAMMLTTLLEGLQVRLKVESDPGRLVRAVDAALRPLARPTQT
jgi:TetR/AcrR family transcriptional regulator, transcriptional repressor for nem operon